MLAIVYIVCYIYLDMIYKIKRSVVQGSGRSKKLGFPTLNVRCYKSDYKNISGGVWATIVKIDNKSFPAATFVGKTKTLPNNKEKIESHLINKNGITNPRQIEIIFIKKLRKSINFKNISDSKKHIQADCKNSLNILKNYV